MDERDTKGPQDTRKVPIMRDGVGYTPSGADDFDYDFDPDAVASAGPGIIADDDMAKTRKITPAPVRKKEIPRPPKNRPKPSPAVKKQVQRAPKKTNYAIFLVTTVFVSVILVVFVFALMFDQWEGFNFGGGQTAQAETPRQIEPEIPPEQPPMEVAPGNISLTGLVQNLNPISREIDLYLFENSEQRSFFAENHTTLRDKFDNPITFSQLSLGDVVEVALPEESANMVIDAARIRPRAGTFNNITDVIIDIENKTLMIGNARFPYCERTIVLYQGEPDNIEDISPTDRVSVDLFRDQNDVMRVVFVDILQGNGIIHIPENDMILYGTVEVANTTFTALEGEMELRVPEGQHTVTIRGINIEDFQYQLTVTRGGSATVDFEGLELLAGSLTVYVEDPYVTFTIDGEVHLTNVMIMLDYGTYTISVTREGFTSFEQEVTIDSANHEITVVLEQIIRTQNVTLTTSPPGARMYLDGEYVGLSPITLELELNRWFNVTFALAGFVGGSTDIFNTEDQPIRSWWLQTDPGFVPRYPTATPPPAQQPTPSPQPLYPEVSPSPTPTPFFP